MTVPGKLASLERTLLPGAPDRKRDARDLDVDEQHLAARLEARARPFRGTVIVGENPLARRDLLLEREVDVVLRKRVRVPVGGEADEPGAGTVFVRDGVAVLAQQEAPARARRDVVDVVADLLAVSDEDGAQGLLTRVVLPDRALAMARVALGITARLGVDEIELPAVVADPLAAAPHEPALRPGLQERPARPHRDRGNRCGRLAWTGVWVVDVHPLDRMDVADRGHAQVRVGPARDARCLQAAARFVAARADAPVTGDVAVEAGIPGLVLREVGDVRRRVD